MKFKFTIKNTLLALTAVVAINCSWKEMPVSFSDVCHENDAAAVQIRGFLFHPNTTPNLTSHHFLVENNNGTGGFIKVDLTKIEITNGSSEVTISGKIQKNEKTCVLKAEKIETP